MEGQQVISSNTVEDFETVAANVRTKIETYFSQLLGIIRKRQTDLISELNEILSRYRQQRMRLMNKVKELEEIKKYHEERSSRDRLNDTLNNIKSDLTDALKASTNTISIEFEWDSVYASQASKIGKLTQITKNKCIDKQVETVKSITRNYVTRHDVTPAYDPNPPFFDSELSYATPYSPVAPRFRSKYSDPKQRVCSPKFLGLSRQFSFESVTDAPTKRNEIIETNKGTNIDVTMPGADCSLFIFSKRLYEGLIYRTDVGPIPRDSYREEQLSSEFAKSPNWRVAIEGCYWCGKPTRANQYTYVCDKKCYSLLHEWCRRKLYEFCGDSLCMYPSCEKPAVETANCCSDKHLRRLEAKFKTIYNYNISTTVTRNPLWYIIHDAVNCSSHSSSTVSLIKLKRSFPAKSSPDNGQLFHKKVCEFSVSQSNTSNTTPSSSYETLVANESVIHKRDVERSKIPPPFNPDFMQNNYTKSGHHK